MHARETCFWAKILSTKLVTKTDFLENIEVSQESNPPQTDTWPINHSTEDQAKRDIQLIWLFAISSSRVSNNPASITF